MTATTDAPKKFMYSIDELYDMEKMSLSLGYKTPTDGFSADNLSSLERRAGVERGGMRGGASGGRGGGRYNRDHETFEMGMEFQTNFFMQPQPSIHGNEQRGKAAEPAKPKNEVDAMFMGDFDDIMGGDDPLANPLMPSAGPTSSSTTTSSSLLGGASGGSSMLSMLQQTAPAAKTTAPAPQQQQPPPRSAAPSMTTPSTAPSSSSSVPAGGPIDAAAFEQQLMRKANGGAGDGKVFDVKSLQGLLKK